MVFLEKMKFYILLFEAYFFPLKTHFFLVFIIILFITPKKREQYNEPSYPHHLASAFINLVPVLQLF